MRCVYFYGCRFAGRCKSECGDARPSDPEEAKQALQDRMKWEQDHRPPGSPIAPIQETSPGDEK